MKWTTIDDLEESSWKGKRETAAKLEDLRSPSGRPYKEVASHMPGLRVACTSSYDELLIEDALGEWAYWCPHELLWIQGREQQIAYYDENSSDIDIRLGGHGYDCICSNCSRLIVQCSKRTF